MANYDVVIVGGGIAGLSAANTLKTKKDSLNVLVLEAKNRLGGRTLGTNLMTTSGVRSWDLGGQWIGKCQPHIFKMINDLGLETFEQYSEGRKIVQLDKNNSIVQYSSDIPPISFFSMLELKLFLWKVKRLVRKAKNKAFMTTELASNLDLCTLEQYKHYNLWSSGAKNALDACCRCIFGTDPRHMSALFFLLYIMKAGSFESMLSCRANLGAQELKIKGGAWQICHRLAAKLPNDSIITEALVKTIDQTENSGVAIYCSDGRIIRCKYVILAIPPNELVRIIFRPQLPKNMFHVLQRMPVGYLTKIIVTYSEAFWRKKGLSGEVVTSGANGAHPLCIVFDASLDSQCPALVGFVGGEQQISFSNKKPEDRRTLVLESLSSFFGPEALNPLDYVEKDWNEEPFNGGCPVNVATPGIATLLTPSLFHPFKSIFFAGTETASQWFGFMDGAVQSGQRAAVEVLFSIDRGLLSAEDVKDTCFCTDDDLIEMHSESWSLAFTLGMVVTASLLIYKLL